MRILEERKNYIVEYEGPIFTCEANPEELPNLFHQSYTRYYIILTDLENKSKFYEDIVLKGYIEKVPEKELKKCYKKLVKRWKDE